MCGSQGSSLDTLLCLQHQHVFTVGKRGGDGDFIAPLSEVCIKLTEAGCMIYSLPRSTVLDVYMTCWRPDALCPSF
jgi:hypothetical protein